MIHLDAIVSCFTFAGGVILANDALRIRKRIQERRGIEIPVDTATKAGNEDLLYDASDNHPLRDSKAIEGWLSERTFRLGWMTCPDIYILFCYQVANYPCTFADGRWLALASTPAANVAGEEESAVAVVIAL